LLLSGCEGGNASRLVAGIGNDNCIENFGGDNEEKTPIVIPNYIGRINRLDETGSEQEQIVGTCGLTSKPWTNI